MIGVATTNGSAGPATPAKQAGEPRPAGASARLHCSGEVRLLILDDDTSVCRLMQAALSQSDFTVDAVYQPSAAPRRSRYMSATVARALGPKIAVAAPWRNRNPVNMSRSDTNG